MLHMLLDCVQLIKTLIEGANVNNAFLNVDVMKDFPINKLVGVID